MLLYNTLSRRAEEFKPLKRKLARMYTCGPTVYNYAHLGNLRTYIFEDTLKRVLKYNGYRVKHVMNITDVGHLISDGDEGEDKIEKGARREGKSAWELADFYTKAFQQDLAELNVLSPDIWCRATDHIKEQIALIKKLEKNGYTYGTADGIYFDTSKCANYGALANLQASELRAGVRVDIGDKKNITDFALWKFSPKLQKRQMEWKSPWGIGFPGWHIECSAMAAKYLGQPFDIHCGGADHIPVHHTNEIAQSESANDKPLANYWLHGEFLLTGTEKMAKSDENFLTLAEIKRRGIAPLVYRYFLLQTHYRKQLSFSWDALLAAQNGLTHLYNSARELANNHSNESTGDKNIEQNFLAAVNNDLDLPSALAAVWDTLKARQISLKTLYHFDQVLGLNIRAALERLPTALPTEVEKLLAERVTARASKDWAKSDSLRREIESLGYKIEDGPQGQAVSSKS